MHSHATIDSHQEEAPPPMLYTVLAVLVALALFFWLIPGVR